MCVHVCIISAAVLYYRARTSSTYVLTQAELNKLHIGPKFEMAYRYAEVMSTIFVCLTFSTGGWVGGKLSIDFRAQRMKQ